MKRISRQTVRRFGDLVAATVMALADRKVTAQEGAAIVLKAGLFVQSLRYDLDSPDEPLGD